MGLKDKIIGAMFEQTPEKPTVVPLAPSASLPTTPAASAEAWPSFASAAPAVAGVTSNDVYYNKLSNRTQMGMKQRLFSALEEGAGKLVEVIPDRKTRYKAAAATVTPKVDRDGITVEFDQVLGFLQSIRDNFDGEMEARRVSEVEERERLAKQKQDQIDALVAEKTQLTQQAIEERAKIDTAKANFEAAYNRRKAELEQQRAEYVALLS